VAAGIARSSETSHGSFHGSQRFTLTVYRAVDHGLALPTISARLRAELDALTRTGNAPPGVTAKICRVCALTVRQQNSPAAVVVYPQAISMRGTDFQYLARPQRVLLQVVPLAQIADVDGVLARDLPQAVTTAYGVGAHAVRALR